MFVFSFQHIVRSSRTKNKTSILSQLLRSAGKPRAVRREHGFLFSLRNPSSKLTPLQYMLTCLLGGKFQLSWPLRAVLDTGLAVPAWQGFLNVKGPTAITAKSKLILKRILRRSTWGWTQRRIRLSEPTFIVVAPESSFSSASVSDVKESRMESKVSASKPNMGKHSMNGWVGKAQWIEGHCQGCGSKPRRVIFKSLNLGKSVQSFCEILTSWRLKRTEAGPSGLPHSLEARGWWDDLRNRGSQSVDSRIPWELVRNVLSWASSWM